LRLYPSAGEAGGSWSSGGEPSSRVPDDDDEVEAVDPDRSAAEAARRARGKIRRYAAANCLNRLGTLTYAGVGLHDQRVFRDHMAVFFRRLRAETGGKAFPYVWVPEWHKSGHGLHAHFAVGSFVPRRKIEAAWGRGFVHIKLLGDLPVGSGKHGEARRAAGYLAKYVGKDFDQEKLAGLHRYEVAQGFAPRSLLLHGATLLDVFRQAADVMGDMPTTLWQSQGVEGWQGPPAVWLSWD
jgi:hypothetical protein